MHAAVSFVLTPRPRAAASQVLSFVKCVIFPAQGAPFVVSRKEEWGGDVHYQSYEELEKAFVDKRLHPQDLKMVRCTAGDPPSPGWMQGTSPPSPLLLQATAAAINRLLGPIRTKFQRKECVPCPP